jgi:RNA polymerase sigma factor (sigma-70 family)
MKITATTGDEPGELHRILNRLEWTPSILAHHSNIPKNTIVGVINLEIIPTAKEANAIQTALGNAGEFLDVLELWPNAFAAPRRGSGAGSQPEAQWESLWEHPQAMELPIAEKESSELEQAVELALARLPKRAHEILRRRFWNGESLQQIGNGIGVTNRRVRQIQLRGLRLLANPTSIRKLAPYLPRRVRTKFAAVQPDEAPHADIAPPSRRVVRKS